MPSPNFSFLSKVDQILVELASRAEAYAFVDPNSALIKTRQFGEYITKLVFSKFGKSIDPEDKQIDRINELWNARLIPDKISQLLHEVRKKGNLAVHEIHGEKGEALFHLKTIRTIGLWYFKTFHDRHFKAGGFVAPPCPVDATETLRAELEELRTKYLEAKQQAEGLSQDYSVEADARAAAEQESEHLYKELEVALELGQEDNERLSARLAEAEAKLAEASADTTVSPTEVQQAVTQAFDVENEITVTIRPWKLLSKTIISCLPSGIPLCL